MNAPDRMWKNLLQFERDQIAVAAGHLWSKSRLDTDQIAKRLGYPESTIYNALALWRREFKEQASCQASKSSISRIV